MRCLLLMGLVVLCAAQMEFQGKDTKEVLDKVAAAIKRHQELVDYTEEMKKKGGEPSPEERLKVMKENHKKVAEMMEQENQDRAEEKKKTQRRGLQDKIEEIKERHRHGVRHLTGDSIPEEL
eukprot:TRINITY_DN25528_c0_g1_i1.p1 TRINITY_DN25528_c0_g1~~TRINITY_DN25528_c0_g1_i1.p1  ORF type:complete len:122 (+),score=65.98 TRINITY_DN25528_c0_g1_i1:67-432(+)